MKRNDSSELKINWPPAGRYVVAVSGGADSVVLLDILARAERDYELVVAHFDHGMRSESSEDERFVCSLAERYKVRYFTEKADMELKNESDARDARYLFLNRVLKTSGAQKIITAHHRDDLIETSLLNLARGTGRRGLAPFRSNEILRPLINVSRDELRHYARRRGIDWREDETNQDLSNPRNFLRHRLLPLALSEWISQYLGIIEETNRLNGQIDGELSKFGEFTDGSAKISRQAVVDLSDSELNELIMYVVRRLDAELELNQRLVRELGNFVKTGKTNRRRPIGKGLSLRLEREFVYFIAD